MKNNYFFTIIMVFVFIIVTEQLCAKDLSTKNYYNEYNRLHFNHWVDIDNDSLDAREQALKEQGGTLTLRSVGQEKVVHFWICPYTAKIIIDPSNVDADHVVPLKWAWKNGADKWDVVKRTKFANDQLNIFIVEAGANRSKGAEGPETWLPSNTRFATMYIERFIQVCKKYDLYYPEKVYSRLLRILKANSKGLDSELLLF